MDEALKRRLVGAAVLLGAAFLLSLLLPKPVEKGANGSGVTIDLNAPVVPPEDPFAAPAPLPAPTPGTAEAPASTEIAAATPEPELPVEAPQVDTPVDPDEPLDAPQPEPEKPAPVKPEPAKPVATKPEPVKAEPVKPVVTKPEPPKPAPVKPEPPKPAPMKAEPPKPAPVAPAKPVPAPATAAKPQPVPAPAGNKPSIWYVQAGSFTDINNARKELDRLGGKGIIAPVETAAGIAYRVRLGPYASKEKAITERDRLSPGGAIVQD